MYITRSIAGSHCLRSTAVSAGLSTISRSRLATHLPLLQHVPVRLASIYHQCAALGCNTAPWLTRQIDADVARRQGDLVPAVVVPRLRRYADVALPSAQLTRPLPTPLHTHRPDLGLHAVPGRIARVETIVRACQLDAARALRDDPALVRDVGAVADPAVS